jgi:hypothetical protein
MAEAEEVSVHAETSDIALSNEAYRMAKGNNREWEIMARQIEMTRRDIVAVERFADSSEVWSRRLWVATWVLAIATGVLVGLTFVLAVHG